MTGHNQPMQLGQLQHSLDRAQQLFAEHAEKSISLLCLPDSGIGGRKDSHPSSSPYVSPSNWYCKFIAQSMQNNQQSVSGSGQQISRLLSSSSSTLYIDQCRVETTVMTTAENCTHTHSLESSLDLELGDCPWGPWCTLCTVSFLSASITRFPGYDATKQGKELFLVEEHSTRHAGSQGAYSPTWP